VRQAPEVAEIRMHAAAILLATGNLVGARSELDRALALDPSLARFAAVQELQQALGPTR
jgi:Flp pilus assembly protein TadD